MESRDPHTMEENKKEQKKWRQLEGENKKMECNDLAKSSFPFLAQS